MLITRVGCRKKGKEDERKETVIGKLKAVQKTKQSDTGCRGSHFTIFPEHNPQFDIYY